MNGNQLLAFTQTMETLARSSIPFAKGLELEWMETKDKHSQALYGGIIKDLRSGLPLHKALQNSSDKFPGYYISLVSIGEDSGKLPEVFSLLSKDLIASQKRNRDLIASVIYPAMLVLSSAVALLFIARFVVPQLLELYKGFGKNPPWFTLAVVSFINVFIDYPAVGLGVMGVLAGLGVVFWKVKQAKEAAIGFIMGLPVVREWVGEYFSSRFFLVFSIQVSGGLTVSQALVSLVKLYEGNAFFGNEVEGIRARVNQGFPLSKALTSKIPMARGIQFARLGEESGNLAAMLKDASSYYEARVAYRTVLIKEMLQPALLLLIGFGVGVLLISLFMPIFQSADLLKP